MATTGTALFPGASTFPNTSGVNPGQGPIPLFRARISFDDLSTAQRSWTDKSDKLRSFTVNRGRNSELEQFDAGTATLVFDNRDRSLDPNNNASVRPLNQVWLYEEFSGETRDIFRGYAESYTQSWDPSGIVDATASVSCADEFKVLTQFLLPAFDPPGASTYSEMAQSDNPSGYWKWAEVSPVTTVSEVVNEVIDIGLFTAPVFRPTVEIKEVSIPGWAVPSTGGGYSISNDPAVVGDFVGSSEDGSGGCLRLPSGSGLYSTDRALGDMAGGTGTVELWFKREGTTGANTLFWGGPETVTFTPNRQWQWRLLTTGAVDFTIIDSTGAAKAVTSGVLSASTWYHLCAVKDGSNLILYQNGVNVSSVASTNSWEASVDENHPMVLQYPGAIVDLDEMAFYVGNGFSAAKALARYTAGAAHGWPLQLPHERIIGILDAADSPAPRTIRAGTRNVHGTFMHSQPPKEEIARTVVAELADGCFFISASGGAVFLDAAHRSSAPWNTSQATYGDGGGAELPYLTFQMDYSDSFLVNQFSASRIGPGSVAQVSSDATSISRYGLRAQSINDLPVTLNADSSAITTALLAKYKDPMQRVTSFSPNMADAETARVTYQRELMDRITVKRRPPGGGSAISQDLFIQRIEHSGAPGVPPTCTLGVSPL